MPLFGKSTPKPSKSSASPKPVKLNGKPQKVKSLDSWITKTVNKQIKDGSW
jgi:hypothetical protein